MTILRQSTARTILVGPILDANGVAKTDDVVASIKVTKNGTVGAADGAATLVHDHAGKYKLALTANDYDTVGILEISLNSGTNDMPVVRINVVETAIWDALFADSASGLLPVNVTQLGGDAQSLADLKDFADAGYDPGTNKVQGVVLVDTTTTNADMRGTDNAALAATALSTAVWTGTLATNIGTTNTTVATNLDATVSSRLASASYTSPPSASAISTQVASDLAAAHGAGLWQTATGFSTHSAADVWAVGARTLTAFGFTVTTANAADVTAILADTNELQTDWTNGGRLNLLIDSIITSIAGQNNLSAADVNAEMLDVINVDTFAELSAPPAATSSLRDKLTWLFMWARNKATETATQRKLFADDTTTVVGTEAVSDDGTTFTKGEAS